MTTQVALPTVTSYPASAWPMVAPIWSELVAASQCSFFLTREWIESWLEVFGPSLRPSILLMEDAERVVGACLLVRNRRGLLPFDRIWLNASGEKPNDTTYIEYNNCLSLPGWEVPVADALAERLRAENWDELVLAGFSEGCVLERIKREFPALRREEVRHPAYYVDLATIRRSGMGYSNFLSGKNGKHLRQNLRYYSALGPLRVEVASGAPRALSMLEELAELSRKRGSDLRRRSIFASRRFLAFHSILIRKCLPMGGIQIARVTAGEYTVGLVYNLIRHRKVYFYQCGYAYSSDKRLSPGRVTLSLVIQHCLDAGYDDFDFLSGESKYKESMSTGSRTVVWARLYGHGVKSRILEKLHRMRRR